MTANSLRSEIYGTWVTLLVAGEPFVLQFTILRDTTFISYRNFWYVVTLQVAREPLVLNLPLFVTPHLCRIVTWWGTVCMAIYGTS